mgnify:CR=1 FL=1
MLKRYILFLVLSWYLSFSSLFAAVITRVDVEGNRRLPEAKIKEYAVKPGSDFDLEAIDKSIKRMFETGLFIDIKTDLRVVGEDLVLTYIIKEKPYVNQVYFEGNTNIPAEKLLEDFPIKTGDILDYRKIEDGLKAVIKKYEEKSYYQVAVEYDLEERENNSIDVVFTINEGSKAIVKKVTFFGNKAIKDKKLKKVISTKKRWLFSWITGSGRLKRDDLMVDRDRIRNEYYNKGYIKVEVGEPEARVDKEKNIIEVVFRIKEGPQYKVSGVGFEGNIHVDSNKLDKTINLHEGNVFSSEKFRKDIENITKEFTSIGYAFANVDPKTYIDEDKHTLRLNYIIEENQIVQIARITIEGNVKTRDRVIRREIKIAEGDIYNSNKIESSKKQLENTDYFEEISLVEEPFDNDTMNLRLKVKEKSTGTFTIGAGFSTLDGVVGVAQIMQKNLFGLGYKLSLRGEIGTERSRYMLNFTNEWLFDKPITLGLDAFRWEDEYFDYDEQVTGGAIRLGHPIIGRKLYMTYRLAYERLEISDIDYDASWHIKQFHGETTTISIAPSLVWSTLNHPTDPSRGNRTELMLKYAGFMGGDSNFVKSVLKSQQYHPILWKVVGMVNGEVGYVEHIDKDKPVPLNERFYLGGMHSVRGYKYGQISPKDEGGYEYGGDKYLLFNVETIFPLSEDLNLKGVLFFDAGNTWDDDESLSSDLKKSVGFGFRWNSPFGPLRVEYGHKLNKREGQSSGRWDFSVGGMF